MLVAVRPGLFDSIQDLGRQGYRGLGVAISGAMDQNAFAQANLLLDNEANDAALEIGPVGGVYRFKRPTLFSLTGAPKPVHLNGSALAFFSVHQAQAEDELTVGTSTSGVFTYLAVKGGFQSECILGSRSMHPSLTAISRLQKGQQLPYKPAATNALSESYNSVFNIADEPFILEAHRGPEFHFLLHPDQCNQLGFTVAEFNRMGYRLLPSVHLKKATESIDSRAVFPGIVQLTPSGECIALHRDAQVSGGYPRILILTEQSLNRLAQCTKNTTLTLRLI